MGEFMSELDKQIKKAAVQGNFVRFKMLRDLRDGKDENMLDFLAMEFRKHKQTQDNR